MLPVTSQIQEGRLVCPQTQQRLHVVDDTLVTDDRRRSYPLVRGIPILFSDPERQERYRSERDSAMYREYEGRSLNAAKALVNKLIQSTSDYRTAEAVAAFDSAIARQPQGSLCLSIGGGPTRAHVNLTNLNLDLFGNVDVVADAYELPYVTGCVDAVHCEAVVEHLERPGRAVREMIRVLRPGGQLFAATPFLQAFHAYPNHYQNFTLEGHQRLFRRAGFEVVTAGTCVGATFALTDLTALYLRTFLPTRLLSRSLSKLATLVFRFIRPLDLLLNRSPEAHVLASTTFVHGRKPESA